MVKAQSLVRATTPKHVIGLPSPATPHSHRTAVQAPNCGKFCNVYVASGARIYYIKVDLPDKKTVLEGKEKLLVPSDAQIVETQKLDHCPHRAEVQCVTLCAPSRKCAISYSSLPDFVNADDVALLGSVDSYGHLMVSKLVSGAKGTCYSVLPPDAGAGEGGWAGCVFSPHQPSLIAVARGFAKCIDLYDKDMHARSFHTLQHPTALTFLHGTSSGSNVIAVSEGPQLSIWDLRAGERGGCMQRLFGSFTGESLYTVCSSGDGLLGTGGADRAITIFDTLRWTPRARWVSCLKYEVTWMAFSAVERNFVFAHGVDYEVAGGEWNEGDYEGSVRRSFAFRGDSRWLGMDKCPETDFMAGWSESGSIFVGHFL